MSRLHNASERALVAYTLPAWLRWKGNISAPWLVVLVCLACLPLVTMLARMLAYPGMLEWDAGPMGGLRHFGEWLNRAVSLAWVPASDRWSVLYVLMLPTATLIIAIARLTLGLRLLGFRSILLAVGFQEIGIGQSLGLLAVVGAVVIALRPAMRRVRLPLYARVAVILCIAASIMVCALLVGPWLHSESIWSVAFFPVIILAMLAEGIARSIDEESPREAAWRTGWTIVVALIIAGVTYAAPFRELMLHFPELLLTELILVVLVAELLDHRLLQHLQYPRQPQGRANKLADAPRGAALERAHVAIVRNRWNTGVIGRIGLAASSKGRVQSVEAMVDVLRDRGFTVKVFEGDTTLARELRRFLAPHPVTGGPGGIVLNLATGIQGRACLVQVPAMLEAFGIAYSGADPLGQARMSDRYTLFTLLEKAGIPVPRYCVVERAVRLPERMSLPFAVRPCATPDATPTIVRNELELHEAVQRTADFFGQSVLLESHHDGAEFRVALLGNHTLECLPLIQVDEGGTTRAAQLPRALATRMSNWAREIFVLTGCRDYARVDFRLCPNGEPQFERIEVQRALARRGSFALAAECAGYSYAELMERIVWHAWSRHGVVLERACSDARVRVNAAEQNL